MSRLIHTHVFLRDHILILMGACLCFYFSYHLLLGERSISRLFEVQRMVQTKSQERDNLAAKKEALEKKVVMMRPGSIDRDLLEERVHLVLGYHHRDDVFVMQN